jgi:hypothetical protein
MDRGFAELRPYLADPVKLATEGTEFVLPSMRKPGSGNIVLPSLRKPGAAIGDWRSINFGTMFGKIIKRTGLVTWPRAWHNLGSSCQTGLTETFPSHVVSAWLGNSERIAEKHYLQVLDSYFQKGPSLPTALRNTPAQNTHSVATVQRECSETNKKSLESPSNTAKQGALGIRRLGDEGFEPTTSTV